MPLPNSYVARMCERVGIDPSKALETWGMADKIATVAQLEEQLKKLRRRQKRNQRAAWTNGFDRDLRDAAAR